MGLRIILFLSLIFLNISLKASVECYELGDIRMSDVCLEPNFILEELLHHNDFSDDFTPFNLPPAILDTLLIRQDNWPISWEHSTCVKVEESLFHDDICLEEVVCQFEINGQDPQSGGKHQISSRVTGKVFDRHGQVLSTNPSEQQLLECLNELKESAIDDSEPICIIAKHVDSDAQGLNFCNSLTDYNPINDPPSYSNNDLRIFVNYPTVSPGVKPWIQLGVENTKGFFLGDKIKFFSDGSCSNFSSEISIRRDGETQFFYVPSGVIQRGESVTYSFKLERSQQDSDCIGEATYHRQ